MMPRVPATCTVDPLGGMTYAVDVRGALAYADQRRTYTLKAKSEDDAAQQGLAAFVDEMTVLDDVRDLLDGDASG